MAIVNELVTKFSYQGSTAPINAYTNSLDGAFSALTRIGAIAGVAIAGIGAMALKAIDSADEMANLSDRINVSMESLQTLGYAAEQSGSSYESMASSLEGLNRQIGLAASGGKAQADVFKDLGISIKDNSGNIKTADAVFVEMQKRMQALGYGTQQTAGVLRKLRLDPTMAQTLNLTTEEMDGFVKVAKEAGLITKEQGEAAKVFDDNLAAMKFSLMSVGNQLMLNLIPAMTRMMDGLKVVIGFIGGFMKGIIQLAEGVYKAVDATIGLQAGLLIAGAAAIWFGRVALMQMVAGFRILAVAMLTNPITWFIAGFVALALVVEDLYQAFTGGESVIGDFFAKFDIDIVNSMINGFNKLLQFLSPIGLAFIGLGLIITGVAKTTASFLNMFGAGINTSGLDAMTKKLSEQSIYMQGIATGDTQVVANRAAYVPSAPTPKGAKQVAGANVQNTVTINGVSDPKEAARLTGRELEKQTRAAATQHGNGGR